MNIIKLTTRIDNQAFYCVAENITCFYAEKNGSSVFTGDNENWCVTETPEQIISLIEQAKKAREQP